MWSTSFFCIKLNFFTILFAQFKEKAYLWAVF